MQERGERPKGAPRSDVLYPLGATEGAGFFLAKSRLLSGQKEPAFLAERAGFFWPRKEPAYAGLSRLLPWRPKKSRLLAKAGFWPERAGFSGQSRLFSGLKEPASAGLRRLLPRGAQRLKEPAEAGVSRLLLAEAGVSRRKPAFACSSIGVSRRKPA